MASDFERELGRHLGEAVGDFEQINELVIAPMRDVAQDAREDTRGHGYSTTGHEAALVDEYLDDLEEGVFGELPDITRHSLKIWMLGRPEASDMDSLLIGMVEGGNLSRLN